MVRWIAALAALGLILARTAALAAPPVEAYGKLPAVEQIGLSPTGGRYVFISVIGETRKLVAVTADGLTPLYAIDVGAAKVVDVSWAGEDHLLVTIFSTEALGGGFNVAKGEFANVVAINLKTRSAFSVFAGHPEVANLVHGRFGVANVAGHWYGYFGGVTYEGGPGEDPVLTHMWADLYRVDLDSGAIHRLEKGDGDVFDWLVGPDGTIVARTMYSDAQRAWQVRAGAINGRVLASGQSDIRPLGRLRTARSTRRSPSRRAMRPSRPRTRRWRTSWGTPSATCGSARWIAATSSRPTSSHLWRRRASAARTRRSPASQSS
jgi:hypothetical protein